MNTKQLACVILIAAMFGIVQLGLSLRKGAEAMEAKAVAVTKELADQEQNLNLARVQLAQAESQSKDLLEFAAEWAPHFADVEDQQAAETRISLKVRESNLLNLSQRFQQVVHKVNGKDSGSLPTLVRAVLVFEDNHVRLLNWLGTIEAAYPTMRVIRAALSKGSRGDDLRMELAVEIPLRKPKGGR
jgi:hypothetical protein